MTVSFSSFSSFSSISTHILTRRMTMVVARLTSSLLHFNSHPHKEDDFRYLIASENENISTHILTRRMTSMLFALGTFTYISTHILTRRMTLPKVQKLLETSISTHILTRRMTAILNKNTLFKITFYINNRHFISIVDIFFHFHIYF